MYQPGSNVFKFTLSREQVAGLMTAFLEESARVGEAPLTSTA